jgi:ABC transport system ATP-binding/permease protein
MSNSPTPGSIIFLSGSLKGNSYPISKATTIGREPSNDIVLSEPGISRNQAQIIWNNEQWYISNVSNQNNMLVNQQEVRQSPLENNTIVHFGPEISFRFLHEKSSGIQPPLSMPSLDTPRQQGVPLSAARPTVAPSQPSAPTIAASSLSASAMVDQVNSGLPTPAAAYQSSANMSSTNLLQEQNSSEPRTMRASSGDLAAMPGLPGGSTAASVGTPILEISTNTDREKQTSPLNKQIINIGRDPSNDIVINRPTVSAFHAQIVREVNQLVLVHPHPSRGKTLNGLTYQGKSIGGSDAFRKPLERGDVFRISDEHGTFVTLTYNDGSGASQDVLPEIHPIPLGAQLITLGRASDNTVVLNHPLISGHHARLEQVQGSYRIVDQGSTNHVFVNAQRIHEHKLAPGDEIRIGPYKLTFTGTQLTQQDESSSVRIDALNLKKVGTKETILINDISIAIPPRKFVALVGGSGAGKSTLMDALNGLRPSQQGTVLYNGQDYYHNLAAFSTQLGYVPQDDIIHRELSVERALYYAAKLRLPADFSEQQIQQRINEVLDDVEMTFRRHLLVNKLSGGQRKRVSIALELLANPSVFFLDEPTSGLDPGLDRKMMLLLRKLADKGHTIVLVTHATNNINACDYVCFLCQGGRLAYFGPPEEAKVYFGKTDFAEIYSSLEPTEEHKNIPAEAEARFKASADYQKYVQAPIQQGPAGQANRQQQALPVTQSKRGNPFKQFWILSMRYLELLRNDTGNLLILLLQAPIIGVILLFLADRHVFDPSSVANCPSRVIDGIPQQLTDFRGSCEAAGHMLSQAAVNPITASAINSRGGADAVLNNLVQIGSGGDAQKILFIMAFAAVMFGCINGAREIVKESAIYRRERTVNLGIMPYMFSKIAVLGTLCLLQSAVLVIFIGIRAPMQHSVLLPPLLETYITLALTSIAGLMVGLTVSAIAPNNDRAMSFIPIILIPQVIFSGIIFPLSNFGMKFLGSFFAAGWSMAGMGTTIGLHSDKLGGQTDCAYTAPAVDPPGAGHFYGPGANPSNCAFRSDYAVSVTNQAGAHAAAVQHLLLIWMVLIVMSIALGALTAYFLKRKDIRD